MEVSSVFVALWNDDDGNVDVVLSSSTLLPSDDEEENEGDDNDAMGVFVYKYFRLRENIGCTTFIWEFNIVCC